MIAAPEILRFFERRQELGDPDPEKALDYMAELAEWKAKLLVNCQKPVEFDMSMGGSFVARVSHIRDRTIRRRVFSSNWAYFFITNPLISGVMEADQQKDDDKLMVNIDVWTGVAATSSITTADQISDTSAEEAIGTFLATARTLLDTDPSGMESLDEYIKHLQGLPSSFEIYAEQPTINDRILYGGQWFADMCRTIYGLSILMPD